MTPSLFATFGRGTEEAVILGVKACAGREFVEVLICAVHTVLHIRRFMEQPTLVLLGLQDEQAAAPVGDDDEEEATAADSAKPAEAPKE